MVGKRGRPGLPPTQLKAEMATAIAYAIYSVITIHNVIHNDASIVSQIKGSTLQMAPFLYLSWQSVV